MKITGTSNVFKQVVDRIEPGAAVGELDVGEDQPGLLLFGQRDRLGMGAGDAENAMTETLDQRFQLHRDEGVVLDDQHVGGDLGGKLAAGFLDQAAQGHDVDVQDAGRIRLGEPFERDQEERLPGQGGDAGQLLLARQRGRPRRPDCR